MRCHSSVLVGMRVNHQLKSKPYKQSCVKKRKSLRFFILNVLKVLTKPAVSTRPFWGFYF